jgi:hypothetical protein
MPETRTKKPVTAWAIKLPFKDHKHLPLCGIYWFDHKTPEWQSGCRVALFSTRATARKWAKEKRTNGQVIKVQVSIGIPGRD